MTSLQLHQSPDVSVKTSGRHNAGLADDDDGVCMYVCVLVELLLTVTICGDACPLSCASAEAYKLAQCTRPQGWGS